MKDDKYSDIYLSLLRMLNDEHRISCMDDDDREYIHDCANPIIIHLCQSGLEHLRLAVKRCRAACMVLEEHKAMNILYNLEKELDNNYDTGDINMIHAKDNDRE